MKYPWAWFVSHPVFFLAFVTLTKFYNIYCTLKFKNELIESHELMIISIILVYELTIDIIEINYNYENNIKLTS